MTPARSSKADKALNNKTPPLKDRCYQRVVVVSLSGKSQKDLETGLQLAVAEIREGCVRGEVFRGGKGYSFHVTDL